MNDRYLLALVLCAVAISLAFWNIIQAYSWDEVVYLSMAKGLLEGRGYGWVGGYTDMHRAPATTYLYYAFFSLFGYSEAVAKLSVILVSLASVLLVYWLGKAAVDKRFGLLAAFALSTNHLFIFFSHRLLPEMLLGFFTISSVLCFWLSLKDKRYLAPTGALVALAFLTRYTSFLVAIVFIIYFILFERRRCREYLCSGWFYASLCAFVLVMLPWLLFNLAAYQNLFGAVEAEAGQLGMELPGSVLIYMVAAAGALLPFFLHGLWRSWKDRNAFMMLLLLFVVVAMPIQNFWAEGLRYFAAFAFVFALASSYRAGKGLAYVFVALCLANAAVGGYVLYNYAYPSGDSDFLLKISTFGDYYTEHIGYKNAALALAGFTKDGETVFTDSYAFVWYYANRPYLEMPSNEPEMLTIAKENSISYAYLTQSKPEFLSKYELIYDSEFAKVYKIR